MPSLRRERLPEGVREGGRSSMTSAGFGLPERPYWHPDTPPERRAAVEQLRREQLESVRGESPAGRT